MTAGWLGHELRCRAVERDQCVVISVEGVLGHSTYAHLRDCLLKHAVEQPRALIVDLSAVTIATTSVLSVFTAVWLRISDWPAIPLLVATGPVHARPLQHTPIRRYVGVFDDVEQALAGVDRPAPRRRASRVLPHHLSSPHGARRFVRQTCAAWNLPASVTYDAVCVASELVQNTVQHTLSEARLRLELRHHRLTVAVGDDSVVPAVHTDGGNDVFRSAKGMRMVAQLTKTWGCVADRVKGCKTVWAVLTA